MTDELVVPDLATPIAALRQWRFDTSYGLLKSTNHQTYWTSTAMTGECVKEDPNAFTMYFSIYAANTPAEQKPAPVHNEGEPCPAPDCRCGVYACKALHKLPNQLDENSGIITGAVALSGRVLQYSEGYRAERASIIAFIDPCGAFPWVKSKPRYHRYLDWAAKQYGVPVFSTAPGLEQDPQDWLREA